MSFHIWERMILALLINHWVKVLCYAYFSFSSIKAEMLQLLHISQTAMKLQEKNTSIVGTINCNRKEIPASVKNMKVQLYDTMIWKHDDCTLTVYQGKVHKNVLVLSILHSSIEVGSNEMKIPETEILQLYKVWC